MTEDEEALMSLGVELRDGIQDMIDSGRLTEADLPDDFEWLRQKLTEMATLCQSVDLALELGE